MRLDLCLGPEMYSVQNIEKLLHFIKREDVGRNSSFENESGDDPVTFGDILDSSEFGEHK
jgi:hypothetical protein